MIILGIETSCDETAVAILKRQDNRVQILSNIVATSLELQSKFGGVFPEQAAREQLRYIIPTLDEALAQAFPDTEASNRPKKINAIAITQGPGLIGSLLIGVETAKTLSLVWQKPLIPINHLIAHFYANWTNDQTPQFPALGLLVSGGHTDLVLFKDHYSYEYLGGTRDDAAGECFDKCARLLGLPYPGGPQISLRAKTGNPKAYRLPKPMYSTSDFDMSFSGLKTAVVNLVSELTQTGPLTDQQIDDLSASIEHTICQLLTHKTILALQKYPVSNLMVAGGVAANSTLRRMLEHEVNKFDPTIQIFIPPTKLCTDNGVSTASAGFFTPPLDNPLDLQADPNLSLMN